ncbi:hypothetical protein SAMD00023353_4300070 [Rosellinia necatrix]|uniref:Uncharacterized protein n=1 Tax=Rosellinia necatrix TaxID=77044 RepID=A0A1S8A9D1_ROSNE|nr:hypothetical protein SAMD00023353_4300070 [Rosellinia necatrix]
MGGYASSTSAIDARKPSLGTPPRRRTESIGFVISRNEQVLVSAGNDGVVRTRGIDSDKLLHQLDGHKDWARSASPPPEDHHRLRIELDADFWL